MQPDGPSRRAASPEQRRELRRRILGCVATVSTLLIAYAVLPFRGDLWWVGAVGGTALLIGMAPFTVRHLRRVLQSDRPLSEAALTLIELLAMLVVAFASIYYAMNRDGSQVRGLETRTDAVYFTVTTLATVGFGDLVATSQTARLVVSAQIVFDLVFVGVTVRVFARAATR